MKPVPRSLESVYNVKPRILDLFCGAGGAAKGYADAGFEVVGVDKEPQPNYPFEFIQYDVLRFMEAQADSEVAFSRFDAIHASPPCQAYSALKVLHSDREYPDLVGTTRELLAATGLPYVIENVPGAPTRHLIVLCGSMFGLGANGRQLRRHRNFEATFSMLSPPCQHTGEAIGVYGGGPSLRSGRAYQGTVAEKAEAMGIDWMKAEELNQAIPPAYTQFIGEALLAHLQAEIPA